MNGESGQPFLSIISEKLGKMHCPLEDETDREIKQDSEGACDEKKERDNRRAEKRACAHFVREINAFLTTVVFSIDYRNFHDVVRLTRLHSQRR